PFSFVSLYLSVSFSSVSLFLFLSLSPLSPLITESLSSSVLTTVFSSLLFTAEDSVRLVDGTTSCSGTVEVFYRGEWTGVCFSWWSIMREVKVVCRELDCGNPVSESRGPLIEDGRGRVRLYRSCSGDESSIRQCDIIGEPGVCDGEYYRHVTCSGKRLMYLNIIFVFVILVYGTNSFSPESVRLVGGSGLCSGRVEVKSNQSWASVCEADFDRQDAEVVCRDVGCGAPAALQGGLYGEGEGQTWDKEFQCKGKESLLLDCDTSDRENNTCLPGNAVGLTCSEPDDVRLVGGGSRCAGGVEWYYQGEWRTVGVGWNQENVAAVVCRQMGCGSTVSVPPGNTTRGFGVFCSGSESSLRECRRSYDLHPGLTVICSESVRLVGGAGFCSGRVEVKSNQSWASVCEADFDQQDAEVVCGELGCGAPAALQGGLYGEGEGQTWDKEFQCKGKESLLLDCDTSDRENNTCLPGNAVGLTCSEPDDVRLVGGGSRCAGGVEGYEQGEWWTVGAYWNKEDEAAVVCRQLGCGSTVSVLTGNTTLGVGVRCSGSESSLRECWRSYDLLPGFTVICSGNNNILELYSTDFLHSYNFLCTSHDDSEYSVRLVNGTTSCSGTVEVFYRGEWLGLCFSWLWDMMGETWLWDMRQVKVVCRELNCGNPVSESRGPLIEDGRGGVRLYSRCSGDESSIRQCNIIGRPGFCDGGYYRHVTCSESVRLVDGAGFCSGRVEVKSNQSWASVCEADFDRQDAEVVCGEFGCGAPAALQGGLYGEGEGQTWDKEFQCKGNDKITVSLFLFSEPDDVRLVGGGSRCAGGVEWYDQGEWRTVGADDWNQRDVAVVVCRQLGCGSTVSVLPGNTTRGFGVYCDGSESSLRECSRSYHLRPGLTVISVFMTIMFSLITSPLRVSSSPSPSQVTEHEPDL
uniref:SRCR domain-containing protein n=1 Tax=Oncorhynchus kisutch TaxID=8019 RepID=A0A8C7KQ85_ONCKI